MKGYCMKCRADREMVDAREVKMANGKPAVDGKCPVCGTRLYRLGREEAKS